MKKSTSSLNVKKKILVKSILFGCAILCPALMFTNGANAMIKNYTNLSPSKLIKKLENEKIKEQEQEKKEYEEARKKVESEIKCEDIKSFSFYESDFFEEHDIGNYPKEQFVKHMENIAEKANNKLAMLPRDENFSSNSKKEVILDTYTKAQLLLNRVKQYNNLGLF